MCNTRIASGPNRRGVWTAKHHGWFERWEDETESLTTQFRSDPSLVTQEVQSCNTLQKCCSTGKEKNVRM